MKKIFFTISVVVFLAGILTSCASHERCPAYGKMEKPEQQQQKKA